MSKAIIVPLMATALLFAPRSAGRAEDEAGVPRLHIALSVVTADGSPRTFRQAGPGGMLIPWDTNLPVPQGDQVNVTVSASTGDPDVHLRELRIRLDSTALEVLPGDVNEPSTADTGAEDAAASAHEWQAEVQVDTGHLQPGHHLLEAWAVTKRPDRYKSVTTSFLVVPIDDPLLLLLLPPGAFEPHPVPVPPPDIRVTEDTALACTIHARDTEVEKELTATGSATVAGPVYFFVSAGPTAREFVYTLTRDGAVTYVSGRLPIVSGGHTYILLRPPSPEAPGLEPGDVDLAVWAGNGNVFGKPARITVHITAEEVQG
jgi:hypothetical protein